MPLQKLSKPAVRITAARNVQKVITPFPTKIKKEPRGGLQIQNGEVYALLHIRHTSN